MSFLLFFAKGLQDFERPTNSHLLLSFASTIWDWHIIWVFSMAISQLKNLKNIWEEYEGTMTRAKVHLLQLPQVFSIKCLYISLWCIYLQRSANLSSPTQQLTFLPAFKYYAISPQFMFSLTYPPLQFISLIFAFPPLVPSFCYLFSFTNFNDTHLFSTSNIFT